MPLPTDTARGLLELIESGGLGPSMEEFVEKVTRILARNRGELIGEPADHRATG